jgi:hypothetical protein
MQSAVVLLGLCPESPEYSFVSKSVSSFSKCVFQLGFTNKFLDSKRKNKIVVSAIFVLSCERR